MTGELVDHPRLHPSIEVHPSTTDVEGLWDRFEIFEALHHSQTICNPMTEAELAWLLDALEPVTDKMILDIACGSGEFLIRCHERGAQRSIGLDLSPWMLSSAAARGEDRLPLECRPDWTLVDGARWARALDTAAEFDTVVCLGAEWIWHGMVGTIAALAELVAPGGKVVYGGPRLNADADPETVTIEFGKLDTVAGVEGRFAACGLEVVTRIDPGEAGWLAYLERGDADAQEWRRRHPGPRADRYVSEQRKWTESYERDRAVVGWSVWIARSGGA